jgi:hypothetical protein
MNVCSVTPEVDDLDEKLAESIVAALEAAKLSYPEQGGEVSYLHMVDTLACIAGVAPDLTVRVLYRGLSDDWFDLALLRSEAGKVSGESVALSLEEDSPQPAIFASEAAPLVRIELEGDVDLADFAQRFEQAADGREVEIGDSSLTLPFYYLDPERLLETASALAPYLADEHVQMLMRSDAGPPAWLVITRGEGAALHPVHAWSNDEGEREWLRELIGEIDPLEAPL